MYIYKIRILYSTHDGKIYSITAAKWIVQTVKSIYKMNKDGCKSD